MPAFLDTHRKAVAYDQLAELAVACKIKIIRANDRNDTRAILNDYYQQSLGVMRRTGLAILRDKAAAQHG